MEKTKEKKRGFAATFRICPADHIIVLLSAVIIALHLLLRGDSVLMQRLSDEVVHPLHRTLSVLCSHVGFSVAELIIGIFVLNIVIYIVAGLIRVIFFSHRGRQAYKLLMDLLAPIALAYALFCVMWGVYYYGEDFSTRSGLESGEISVEELENATRYFAALTNEYSGGVERDERGVCCADRARILEVSPTVFDAAEGLFPCLEGDDIAAKGVYFSRVMSYVDFTGFFFPFTGEANVNTDFPPSLFAATVAHELSHQRGIAKEQEANFTAVLACMTSGDADYLYSGSLMAYVYLGNALYSANYDAWLEVYESLNDEVRADIVYNRAYWAQFDTPAQTVSNTVYEGFLHSYDQHLGLQSYGACVDLLVNYYGAAARGAMENNP